MSNLANTIIMGAQKCGTTTLYHCLRRHPEISTPVDPDQNKPIKEIDFYYDEKRWKKGLDWYKSHFKSQNTIYLDSSPNYLSEPLIYQRLLDSCPNAKLIICLRNPIDRAYSAYNHYRQDMPLSTNYHWDSSLNFEDNILAELESDRNYKFDFKYFLGRGIYINQIEPLLHYFDSSQIYITIMEQWNNNFRDELFRILRFLNVDTRCIDKMPSLRSVHHNRAYTVEPLGTNVLDLLRKFYTPYNRQLFDFLGHEIPEWVA